MKSLNRIYEEFLRATPVPRRGFCKRLLKDGTICGYPKPCKRHSKDFAKGQVRYK